MTKISANQMQICWQSVSGATTYRVIEEVGVRDFRVDSTATGTICATVALLRDEDVVNSCQGHRIKVAAGTISGDSLVQGPYSPPSTVQLNPVFDDPTLPDPWCDPNNAIAGVWDLQGLAPTALTVTDITAANATTPSIKLTLVCPAPPTGISKDHYEIYESIRNANGTTTTRTTSSNTCPNNKTLGGSWGQRVTVTVAGVYATGSGQSREVFRGRCSPPAGTTYGGIIVPSPTLTVPANANASTVTINGSVPTTNVITVLLFVNPTNFNQGAPTQTITSFTTSGGNKNFTAIIPLNPTINTVYAVTTTGSGSTTKYSKPSAISFIKNYPPPLAAPTWGTLPSFQLGGGLYLTGTTAPGARVVITPTSPGGATLPTLTADGCTEGTFGVAFPLAGLAAGTYTFTVRTTDAGSTGESTTTVHINEIYPAPTLTLDLGVGPLYVNASPVSLKGKVTPANLGKGFTVTGIVGGQTVTTTPFYDVGPTAGFFTLPPLTLGVGTNNLSVTAIYNPTGQSPTPINTTITYDNQVPTATVNFLTQMPDPTNQPTWTLNGNVTGYQGGVENSSVAIVGTTTRLPIAADGTWSGSHTFAEGQNLTKFAVSDQAGNLGPQTQQYKINVATQAISVVFENKDTIPIGSTGPWPATLDRQYQQKVIFKAAGGGTLRGSHLNVYLDEPGNGPGTAPATCLQDNLTCLVARHSTPDLSLDITEEAPLITLPTRFVGLHNIRMVLNDPFGRQTERGTVVQYGPYRIEPLGGGGSRRRFQQPLSNLAVPGVVTTRLPKLAGRTAQGMNTIDCNDGNGTNYKSISYWSPGGQGGGSYVHVALASHTVGDGIFEITIDPSSLPQGQIPVTTDSSGQSVLRLCLEEVDYYRHYYGRTVCNASGQLISHDLEQHWETSGSQRTAENTDCDLYYDLPYRAPQPTDDPAPQIDTSATTPTSFSTDDDAPLTTRIAIRITDLNGDLDYRSITITPPGCADASCVIKPRLDGDQKLAQGTRGGWYSITATIPVGQNTFVVSARDDAGHATTSNLIIYRTLTPIIARITRPSASGSFGYPNPRTTTFDASGSTNRTGNPLRFQWTSPTGINGSVTTWSLTTSASIYSEYLAGEPSGFNKRRVIVSNSTITPEPNPTIDNPCASFAPGQCSTAQIIHNRTCTTTGFPLTPIITAPSTGASVALNLPVTLSSTAGNDASPYYVYRWDLTNNNTGETFSVPQAAGPSGDGYANSNRMLTLNLGSITGVVPGSYLVTLSAGTNAFGDTCIQSAASTTRNITVVAKQYQATGLAPGVALPGSGGLRLYGAGFDSTANVVLRGPVYSLENTTTPLCDTSCPQQMLATGLGAGGTSLDFALPFGVTFGYYQVFAADPATGAASSPVWLEVQPLQGTAPAKTQSFSGVINPILNGQTLNGQFLAGRDPSGQFSDVDYYYFFATAGSSLDLSLTRTDTSLPWEVPDALDPQLVVVDPDGLVWQGFESLDNQAGVDLNASLNDLVLPKTGRYNVYAANSKGFGAYQLAFSLTPAPPPSNQQVLPATNNDRTVPLNTAGLKPMAFTFDPRGHPLSGAVAQFVSVPEANETGQISFPGGSSIATSTRGFAQVDATLVAAGKVSFEARLLDTGLVVPQGKVVQPASAPLPTYRPLGIVSRHEQGTDPLTGAWTASFDKIERLELAPPDLPVVAFRTGKDGKKTRQQGQVGNPPRAGPSRMLKDGQPSAGSSPSSGVGSFSMDVITTCSPGQFRAAGVNVSAVQGPFTVTLKDLTPKTGEPSTPPAEEVIGVAGINRHRVDKTIRIRFEIKDAAGAEPNYPVLVRLSLVGGTPSGTLILDPDGARTPCQSASFLWHERNAQGQIIALNEEFEYQLTKRSVFVGVKPDPETPGEVLPVWGTTEFLSASFGTFDAQDGTLTNQFSANYSVHPEPGTPDHFKWNPTLLPPPHRLEYLAAYGADFGLESETFTNGLGYANLYYLADVFDNSTYGHTATSATSPAPNIQVAFAAQQVSDDPTEGSSAYRLTINWNDNPTGANPKPSSQWPNGEFVTTLTVTGTDVETGPFSVSQNFTAAFSQPEFYSLVWVDAYDPPGGANAIDTQFDFSVNPPVPITFVSPGAARTFLNGDLSRNSILLVTGTRLSWTSVTPVGWIGPPGSDPTLVTDGLDSFDVSLVDDEGNLVEDSGIEVAFCTKYYVDQNGPCPTGNRTSSGGVILGVRPTDRGYMGLMVTKAPGAPGVYFLRIRPLPSNVHQWRIGGSLDSMNNYTYTYAVTVRGGEFLDEHFRRVDPATIRQPMIVYVRSTDRSETQSTFDVVITTEDDDSTPIDQVQALSLTRLGRSSVFLSEQLELHPAWSSGASSKGFQASASANRKKVKIAKSSGRAKVKRSSRDIASTRTVSAGPYSVVMGLRLPLKMYKSFSLSQIPSPGPRYFICSPVAGDCGSEVVDPDTITWSITPASAGVDGVGQVARIELERDPSPDEWLLRGIRTTKTRVDGGRIEVTAQSTVDQAAHDTVSVEITRPSKLGTDALNYPGYPAYTVNYEGTQISLRDLIIETADEYGIPPQYLAAQAHGESSFNPYAFRYEPSSKDFKTLSGDWGGEPGDPGTVEQGQRNLLNAARAHLKLGVPNTAGEVEFLPCEDGGGDECIVGQSPPPLESAVMTPPTGSSMTFQIPGLGGEAIQLGVRLCDPASIEQCQFDSLVQRFPPCGTLGPNEYCVNGDTGTLSFGSPQAAPVTAWHRRVRVITTASPPGFGSIISDIAAAIGLIRQHRSPGDSSPPTNPHASIREWMTARGSSNPLVNNSLTRYGRLFNSPALFELAKADPSFGIQGQWFAAASYGLMQIIPDEFRRRLEQPDIMSPAELAEVRARYDPMEGNPIVKLFDPRNCVPLGAFFDVHVKIEPPENQDPAWTTRPNQSYGNQTTWDRLWKKRLCLFNTGNATTSCGYAGKIIDSEAGFFIPQP